METVGRPACRLAEISSRSMADCAWRLAGDLQPGETIAGRGDWGKIIFFAIRPDTPRCDISG